MENECQGLWIEYIYAIDFYVDPAQAVIKIKFLTYFKYLNCNVFLKFKFIQYLWNF